jgi:hypothetical protein
MDEQLARVIIIGVIGLTVTVSMIATSVAQVLTRRRKSQIPDASVANIEERLARIEQAIDAMATEVERVSEGQRFTSRLLAEKQTEHRG